MSTMLEYKGYLGSVEYSDEDDEATDDFLHEWGHTGQHHAVADQPDEQHTQEGAKDRPGAPHQRGAADDHSRDDLEFQPQRDLG